MSARVRRIAVAVAALAVSASLGVATVGSGAAHTARVVADNSWCC